MIEGRDARGDGLQQGRSTLFGPVNSGQQMRASNTIVWRPRNGLAYAASIASSSC
jgi:hypothetical protein